jgi:hypothetical protein
MHKNTQQVRTIEALAPGQVNHHHTRVSFANVFVSTTHNKFCVEDGRSFSVELMYCLVEARKP